MWQLAGGESEGERNRCMERVWTSGRTSITAASALVDALKTTIKFGATSARHFLLIRRDSFQGLDEIPTF